VSLRVVDFREQHIQPASELAAEHVAAFRKAAPLVPERWTRPETYVEPLARLIERQPGAAALLDGRLVGFLCAMAWEHASQRNVHSPEWANVCTGDAAALVRQELYSRQAEAWLADRRTGHFIGLLPTDDVALSSLGWLGFGHSNIDGLRDLQPIAGRLAGVDTSAAGSADAGAVLELELGLREHLASTPLFLELGPALSLEEVAHELADERSVTFLSRDERGPLAFLRIGPASSDASTIVRDAGTASITRAFTRADRRGGGVASSLLDAALGWAREQGYVRCAVDYESANLLASRFWARHFQVVGITVRRRI
jgi:GNAT superfamily N-acetyltransferase